MVGNKEFSKSSTLAKAITTLKKAGVQHDCYCHYTTLESVRLMLKSKTFWLRRCCSKEFDDRIEQQKFGKKEEQNKFYLACFSFGDQELASMWGLYCPPTYQAVRVKIGRTAMLSWIKLLHSSKTNVYTTSGGEVDFETPIKKASAGFNDIVYASVKTEGADDIHDATLMWNRQKTHPIEGLEDKASWSRATGMVKDVDWMFENESRMWVKMHKDINVEQIAINLPEDVIKSFEFTLSPWLKDYEEDFTRDIIRSWVGEACGDKGDYVKFKDSGLRGGLQKWATRRGV